MSFHAGRHFLQIPGPTNVPDRVLRAMDFPTIDHRGPEFAALGQAVLTGIREVFGTVEPVVIFPSSGTGAWEAALVNVLSPGDRIVAFDNGNFAAAWTELATRLGYQVEIIPGVWGARPDLDALRERLRAQDGHLIRAVCVVHNETSTGVTADIGAVRACIDDCDHEALFLVDTISSLGSIDYQHDAWGIDVTVCGSQKGLMLPPGLGFNAISQRAVAASKTSTTPRSYWDWSAMLGPNANGFFPYTPATNLLYGLDEALKMLREEGLSNVYARHTRLADACRAAVDAWGLEFLVAEAEARSNVLTAVCLEDADRFRKLVLENYDMSLGAGLAKLSNQVFRIGHLGHMNELMLAGTLSGVEMGLRDMGLSNARGGVVAALDHLAKGAH
ncbi:MAG: aminotransferase class V-fold PLP-dependent enzyme [Pseudomonadota bacterium]